MTARVLPLDLDRLTRRLGRYGVASPRPLAGGASSLTYLAELGERPVVVKVAPPGVAPTLNRDVLRQARLLHALAAAGVPVPVVLEQDAGDPPDEPPFFVMSFLEGSCLEPLFDLGPPPVDAGVVAERLRSAARALAALHRVDPVAVGLGSEPIVGLGEEIDRWGRLLATVDQQLVPGWESVARSLSDTAPPTVPDSGPAAIVHGDFRLGNVLAAGSRVTAIVDWEIWSIGDPRVDVGWFLLNADPDAYGRPTPYVGQTPSVSELAACYGAVAGRELTDLSWFRALAAFKSAATWSLIVKHNRRRAAPDPAHEAMAPGLPKLLSYADRLLTEGAVR